MASKVALSSSGMKRTVSATRRWRQRHHHMACLDDEERIVHPEGQDHMVALVLHAVEHMVEAQALLADAFGENRHQTRHAAGDPPRAAMHLLREPLGILVRLGQVQHRAFVMLGIGRQAEFRDEGGNERLGVGPEPGGTEIEGRAVAGGDG